MVAKIAPSKAFNSRSTPVSTMVVCAVWVVLLLLSSSANAADSENVLSRQSERNLPSYYYYEYYSKKSKNSKGSKGGHYSYYGSKGSKGGYYSYKSDKKEKDCKSAKKHYNYYGYYDHCFEEIDVPIDDGNSTDIEEIFSESKSYKSKGSKGSKGSYSYYSKSYKSKSDKKDKSHKSDKKSNKPTMAPTKNPDIGFEPPANWNKTFVDAVDTGFLFYDPVTSR